MRLQTTVVALAALALLLAADAHAWRTDVTGTPAPSRPSDVTTLADGTVVAAGRIRTDGLQEDAMVVAFDGATGMELWRHLFAGDDTTANDLYRRVVPGSGGTVIAAGRVFNVDTGADALIVRLDGDGMPLWASLRDGGEGLTDDVQDVAVLAAGDIVAVGRLEAGVSFGSFAVWRLDAATGDVLWTRHLDAPGGVGRRIALSPNAAYVVGETDATGSDDDVLVARVALADGAVSWMTTIGGDAAMDDDAIGVGFAGDQVTILANAVHAATGPDGLVVGLAAADGAERWRTLLDGATVGDEDDDGFSGLAVAPGGDAIVAGTVTNPVTRNDLLVARLDAGDGRVAWRTERDGGNEANDDARGVAFATLGTADGAFVTGRLREPNVRGEIAALRIDATTGHVRWQRAIEGGSDRNDIGLAIAVEADGDVVIGGRARRDDTGDEFAVLKLSAESGGSFPCGDGSLDEGEDCDDANTRPGDGCRANCTVEVCGDGIQDPQEQCDDPASPCCVACVFPPGDTACDDGDACTLVDVCVAGECLGTEPMVCPAAGQCETTACDVASGRCLSTPRPDATTCNDGNACTRSDQCRDGVCLSGVDEVCDDFEPCTVDGCDAETGCTFTPLVGLASVGCAVDGGRIDQQCDSAPPAWIARRLIKTTTLLDKASAATTTRRVRRLLGKIARLARRAGKKSNRLRARDRVSDVCGETLVRVFADIEARARAVRAETF